MTYQDYVLRIQALSAVLAKLEEFEALVDGSEDEVFDRVLFDQAEFAVHKLRKQYTDALVKCVQSLN